MYQYGQKVFTLDRNLEIVQVEVLFHKMDSAYVMIEWPSRCQEVVHTMTLFEREIDCIPA